MSKKIKGLNWILIQPNQKDLNDVYNKSFYHSNFNKICIICDVKFKYGRSNLINCKQHKLIVECPVCHKMHELNFDNLSGTQTSEIINKIHKNEEIYHCCSLECRQKLIYENQKKNKTGWCSEKAIKKKNSNENNYKRYLIRVKNGTNIVIHKCKNENCKNYDKEIFDECPDNMWYCKQCGWKPQNSILNEINFLTKNDGLLYFLDRTINKYVYWEDYKTKFKNVNLEIDFVNKIKFQYPNAFIQPTFRTQDSDSWNGAKAAFEQNLLEQDINWFTYIKFYINTDGDVKPLVVGKSGSLNVNIKGSDVSFSTDINDGPARRFLIEIGMVWDKTKILIIPCKNENEAFKIEKEIAINFNLFES